jgi:uncharacterized protein YjcR
MSCTLEDRIQYAVELRDQRILDSQDDDEEEDYDIDSDVDDWSEFNTDY